MNGLKLRSHLAVARMARHSVGTRRRYAVVRNGLSHLHCFPIFSKKAPTLRNGAFPMFSRNSSHSSSQYLALKHLQRLEREANASPHSAGVQAQYLRALNKIRPDEVVNRVESGLFASNKETSAEYIAALSRSNGGASLGTRTVAGGQLGLSDERPIHVAMAQPTFKQQLWRTARSVLGIVLLFSFLGVALEERGGGGGGIGRAMGMGLGKEPVPVTSKERFDDVKGAHEAKDDLREIISFLQEPERFTKLGGKLPKGVLLTGPPGTGKTLLARACAGEAGVPFFYAAGSEFEEMFVGVGARRVRDLFTAAKKNAPCIVFIDEIDAIGGKRAMKDQSALKMTLNQLLVELDGFEKNEGVIVVAATNFPDSLDPALVRPGRFDRNVVVPLPSLKDREDILGHYLSKIPLAADVDARTLARGTPGASGAELSNLVNAAAVQASLEGHDEVSHQDLEWAKDKIFMGAERKSLAMRPQEIWNTACHESGHALVALLTPGADPIHKATIIPRGRALGMVFQLPENDVVSLTRTQLLAKLDVCMGGRVAEELMFGRSEVTTGATSDMQSATNLARRMVMQFGFSAKNGLLYEDDVRRLGPETRELIDSEVRKLLDEAYARTMALMSGNKHKLVRLATALREYETLSGAELSDIVNGKPLSRKAPNEKDRKMRTRQTNSGIISASSSSIAKEK